MAEATQAYHPKVLNTIRIIADRLLRPPHRRKFRDTSEHVCAPVQSDDAVYRFRARTMALARTGNSRRHSHTLAACLLDFLCRRYGTSPS